MDLSAAFDMVYHDILLLVLNKRFGIQGVYIELGGILLMTKDTSKCV